MGKDLKSCGHDWEQWGRDWAHGWKHHQRVGRWHHRRSGFSFFWPVGILLALFLAFGVLKLFWPLLVIGVVFMLARNAYRWQGHGSDGEKRKRKNDDDDQPPPSDGDRRYVRTADGDWLEII